MDLGRGLAAADVAWGDAGLVAGVVQDVLDGRVLMVGWLDAEALAATLDSGEVHFHSRSRGRLWRKGETSGNVLRLRTLAIDCDGDALLLGVEPAGPACHRGTRSCFDAGAGGSDARPGMGNERAEAARPGAGRGREVTLDPGAAGQAFGWLETLWATMSERAAERPAGSYTARLIDGGVDLAGRKVTEEATEVLLAAKNDEAAQASGADRTATRQLLAGEAADLVYHALALLAERGLEPRAVIEVLQGRHGTARIG